MKRYRAHRALGTVVLGWTVLRILVHQGQEWSESPAALRAQAFPARGGHLSSGPRMASDMAADRNRIQAERAAQGKGRKNIFLKRGAVPALPAGDRPFFVALQAHQPGDASSAAWDEKMPSGSHTDPDTVSLNGRRDHFASRSPFSLYGWVYVRQHSPVRVIGPNGQLGGSQAGLRGNYWINDGRNQPALSLSLRATRPLAMDNGAEVAPGLEIRSHREAPWSVIVERRIGLDQGGRDAWAAMIAGGFYRIPLGHGWHGDGYGQAGVVGIHEQDAFVDGAMGIAYSIDDNSRISAGAGVWGGAQPRLHRLDIGPRATGAVVLESATIHWELGYRIRLAGKAQPSSGLAFTVSSGF